jgi:hypothetical protein
MRGYEPVRVAVEARRNTVGGPTGVGNASVRVEDLGRIGLGLLDQLLQLGHLANLLEGKDFILLVTIDGETGGIVATVLEAGET